MKLLLGITVLSATVISAYGSVQAYDELISSDAAGGFAPLARLSEASTLTGSNRVAFNFGTNSGSATIEFILEGNPAPSTSAYLAVGANTISNLRYELAGNSGQLGFTQLGVLDYLFSPSVASPTVPTHVTYVWNAGTRTMKLYRNGALAGARSGVDPNFSMPTGQGWLGANPNNQENMTGTIHRVTVYDGLVSEEVIRGHSDAFNGVIRPPVIVSFTATPGVIFTPAEAVLRWDVRNADLIRINGANVTALQSLSISPVITTSYSLVASNSAGSRTSSITVLVNPSPVVRAFTTSKAYLAQGESTTLSWNVEHAHSVAISPDIGNVTALTVSGTGSTNIWPKVPVAYTLLASNTFGTAGSQVQLHLVQPASHLVISEFMANDQSVVADEDGEHSGWIEIHNPTTRAVNLANHYLTDDQGNPLKWPFPPLNLEPDAYLLAFASGKNRTNAFSTLHTSFRLDNNGEYLALIGPGPSILHAFDPSYPPQSADISYGLLRADVTLERFFGLPTPGLANIESTPPPPPPEFSLPGGTFTQPFLLSLRTTEANAQMVYTLDGSDPRSSNGIPYSSSILISNTTRVRAVAVTSGRTSRITGTSFIKLSPQLTVYTSCLPLIVVENFGAGVIPQKGWTASGAGITQVPRQDAAWVMFERVEGVSSLTNSPQLLSRIGIRGRGAYSTQWRQKPYSVEAADEDGAELEVSPLGMPAHADWVLYFPDPDQNKDPALLFNTFAYELSKNMGNYAVRFRWVEAFINEDGGELTLSDRRGIYAIIERVSRGKNRLDFQRLSSDGTSGSWLLNINRMDPEPEDGWPAPNGATRPWFFHTAGANRIVETTPDTSYSTVPGDDQPRQWNAYINFDNPNGYMINAAQRAAIESWFREFEDVLYSNTLWRDPVSGYRRYIDTPDFIDYFVMNVLTRSGDGLLISMFPWKGDDGRLRMGPAWDYNWSSYFVSGGPTGSLMHRSDRLWYQRLFADPDFLQAYIDRWWDLRRGPMSNSGMEAIIDGQVAEISLEKSLLNGMPSALEWSNRIIQFKSWLRQRADWIDSNYLRPPAFNQNGGTVPDGFVVSISATNGSVFFTTNGVDPRAAGGTVDPAAQVYSLPFPLRAPTLVQARVKNGTNWSGSTSAFFRTPQDLSRLLVSEIMYNPAPWGSWTSDDLEFIELMNSGTNVLNLSGLSFTAGITFSFDPGTVLGPGQFFVLVKNAVAFQARYPGVAIGGVYSGRLDNGGETLRLSTAQGAVFDFGFGDRAPWPLPADGYGFSLVPADITLVNNSGEGSAWRVSASLGGSPGSEEPVVTRPQVVINEILSHSDLPQLDFIELYNPAPQSVSIGGWFLSDDGSAPKKYRIPAGTIIPPLGFKVFSEFDFNPAPGTALNFSLNSSGDAIYLTAADAAGNFTGAGHGIDFGAAANGESFGRYINSVSQEQFPTQMALTPGSPNIGPAVGPVVLTEVMYQPCPGGDEFVELKNITASDVALFDPAHPENAWEVSGFGYRFPTNLVLPPGGLVLVVATNPMDFRIKYSVPQTVPVLGPSGGLLQDGGERLQLRRPDRPETNGLVPYICTEELRYDQLAPWPAGAAGGGDSLQRRILSAHGNDPANWFGGTPNPGIHPDFGGPPVILQPPLGQSVVPGASVTFSVTISNQSTLPLGYRWVQNSVGVSSNPSQENEHTSFLTISNAQPAYTNYSVIVSNLAGVAHTMKSPAVLTFLTDSDADGLPDEWEARYGLATNSTADAWLDRDADRMTNWQEYVAGTDPSDPLSYLRIESITANSSAAIHFHAVSNRTYTVEYSNAPHSGPWIKLTDVPAQPRDQEQVVVDSAYAADRFYRLVTPRGAGE